MNKPILNKIAQFWLFGLLFALGTGQALAEAGHVIYVSGDASLERAVPVPLAKDSVVESGDVITTGSSGHVQLRMANGEFIALRPNSRFVIDEFAMPTIPAEPSTGRSFYSLLKGGFMAVTNSFGARDLNSYRIHTPVATLGIRGSTIGGFLDDNGLTFGVKEGGGSISNSEGIQLVDEGQAATVADTFTAPKPVTNPGETLGQIFDGYLPPADVVPPPEGTSPPEGGTGGGAAGEGAASAGSGDAGKVTAGTVLLILGGAAILAEAVGGGSGNGGGSTGTTGTTGTGP